MVCPVENQHVHTRTQKEWPFRRTLLAGLPNIISDPIFSQEMFVIPLLHSKLGLMKQFVKALNPEGGCFQYIFSSFSALSFEKATAVVFGGPQIQAPVRYLDFVRKMNVKENPVWLFFKAVVQNFLGNRKTTIRFWLLECCWHFVNSGAT
ncbi:hypothetical protein AVEN_229806-1 [Araneus ventricosus]|uniref:Uncharacterized protein n=1 Tax=Araneus ventricosus TaxID=182803 RepID=A0A4Y2LJJ6_ARAVE|nr:hypothetical protein AVEN_229806-1 [Araneus ventricosus]